MKRRRVLLRSLGKKIKTLRMHKIVEHHGSHVNFVAEGISQSDLAKVFNVSLDTVKNWEQGYNYPSIDTLIDLANYFDCDFDYLLGVQKQPRKIYAHVSEYTGFSENAVEHLLTLNKNHDPAISLLSALIEDSDFLHHLSTCVGTDYGKVSTFALTDPFTPNGKPRSIYVTPEILYHVERTDLYNALISFINAERNKRGLTIK